jgi:predicted nucleic acid-binding protein
VGCANKNEFQALQKFLVEFEIVQLNNRISLKAVELFEDFRLSHGVMIPDMLIAATAITLKIPLLSKNQKDFRFIDQLNLREYKV